MSRRRRISDLPIPGFDRSVRSSFSIVFNLLTTTAGLGYKVYKQACATSLYRDSYSSGCYSTAKTYVPGSRPQYKKAQFKDEIDLLEDALRRGNATLQQCKRLGAIYSLIGDPFKERYARLCAIICFLKDNGLDNIADSFLDSFNNPCKRPPIKVCEDESVNTEYGRLLSMAENAKRKCNSKLIRR